LSAPVARKLLEAYARAETLAAFGVAALARKVDDASELAQVTGTSMGKAKAVVSTRAPSGGRLRRAPGGRRQGPRPAPGAGRAGEL
jgi:hypothetical protein